MFSKLSILTRFLVSSLAICYSFFIAQESLALEGGQPVNAADYPGLVILSYGSIPDTFVSLNNCSGIVLEPRKILTSASCFQYYNLNNSPVNTLIPANKVFVHPVTDGEIGGSMLLPPVNSSTIPRVNVASYVINPQNTSKSGHHNLAVLTLSSAVKIAPALFYNGQNKFIGISTTALGWEREDRTFSTSPFTFIYYVLRKLSFNLIDGNTNRNGLCYDNFSYTGTVFCSGFRNGVNFLDSQDEGAPIYRTVNGRKTTIGLLFNASHGRLFDGQYDYEKYARISSMVNFIRQHAPNTQFWNESSIPLELPPSSIIPILQLLLLNE